MNGLKRLVLFGTRIGLNFSGGSNATVMLFQHIVQEFEEVFVVAQEIGPLHFPGTHTTMPWYEESDAIETLQGLNQKNCIFYGDFWDSIYLVRAKVPFFFTYHDNWPEQKYLDLKSWRASFNREKVYKQIFKKATHVFSVTQQKRTYIGKQTRNHSLVRNGSCMAPSKFAYQAYSGEGSFRILMVGNLDQRKYKLAVALFSTLVPELKAQIQIDIFGHLIDHRILRKLDKFSFVKLKGFSENIDYSPYHLFLSTSQSENLPISMLESLINYTPVLSFDIGGISELVRNEGEGILIAPFDIEKMADILNSIFNQKYSFSFNRDKLRTFDWEASAQLMLNRFRASLYV